eukprot:1073634-Rhodomonas_salina.1
MLTTPHSTPLQGASSPKVTSTSAEDVTFGKLEMWTTVDTPSGEEVAPKSVAEVGAARAKGASKYSKSRLDV